MTATETIIRRSAAQVEPEKLDEFISYLVEQTRRLPGAYPGLLDHRILCDRSSAVVVYESAWASIRELQRFAGESWRSQPVLMPGEEVFLRCPPAVQHFHEVPIGALDRPEGARHA